MYQDNQQHDVPNHHNHQTDSSLPADHAAAEVPVQPRSNELHNAPQTIENQKSKIENPNPAESEVRHVLLDQIIPNPHQPRRHFDEDALLELAESIQQHGVLQPILLRQRPDNRLEIIAGERRYRAAQLIGLTAIPALIRALDECQQSECALIENLQRADLNTVETARALHAHLQKFGTTQQQIAERIGKSQTVISRLLQLLKLPDYILDSLQCGNILEAHAQALLTIKDQTVLEYVWQQLTTQRLTAHQTRRLIRSLKGCSPIALENALAEPQPPAEADNANPAAGTPWERPDIDYLVRKISRQYNAALYVQNYSGQSGHLEIPFLDEWDLRRTLEKMDQDRPGLPANSAHPATNSM